jgi:AcrR family transcriptional regulator
MPSAAQRFVASTEQDVGRLYRHFPTREALIEAAYRNELARLCDAVPGLLESRPPDEALRTWMDRFSDYTTTKRGMAEALRVVIASGGSPFAQSRDRLVGALATLLRAGAEAGTIRPDADPGDVLASLSGVSLAAGEAAQRDQAGCTALTARAGSPRAPGGPLP